MFFYIHVLTVIFGVVLRLKTSYAGFIILKDDSPTTIGGSTKFSVQVFGCGPGNAQYEYCYEYIGKKCVYSKGRIFNFTISNWQSSGIKKVTVIVQRHEPQFHYCGTTWNKVNVTDTIIVKLKTTPSEDFKVGPVLLSAQIHDPSHLFKSFMYYWDFGDGSYLNATSLGEVKHNFTENLTYKVRVQIFSYARGQRYNGTATTKDMKFDVDLDPKLMIITKNMSSVTLPSDRSDTLYVARGYQLVLIVTYSNPYSIVKNISTQWSFGGRQQTSQPGNSITHTFVKDGKIFLWVTATFVTKRGNPKIPPFLLHKYIVVEEPITGLSFENKSITIPSKYFAFNIWCQGSGPFKMCWKLHQNSIHGDPLMENCTVTPSPSCQFNINHTISQKGMFILKITVLNRVGSAQLVKHFSIPEPVPPPHHSAANKAVSVAVPIIICLVTVIILIFIARKIYTIRHRSVLETADFDFRDEDCRSVDSMTISRRWCPSFRWCKTFSRSREYYPLLESWDTKSSTSYYSTIL